MHPLGLLIGRPAVLAGILLAPAGVFAQPQGTYRQTCDGVAMQGDTLIAHCKDRGGARRESRLDSIGQCIGGIFNDNGMLRCSRGASPPAGDYQKSCQMVAVSGYDLRARCRSAAGAWTDSVLSGYVACRSQVANIDGHLSCTKGVSDAPRGSYSSTCYDINFDGTTLTGHCRGIRTPDSTTALDTRGCIDDISNLRGFLTCAKGDPAPAGTYRQTCVHIVTQGGKLQAQCIDRSGNLRNASIDASSCPPAKLDNIDGVLVCGAMPPSIQAAASGSGGFHVTGTHFSGSASVRIRVVAQPSDERSVTANAKGDGSLDTVLSLACNKGSLLHFSATDGRENKSDVTGVLWSNVAVATCQ